MDSAHGTPKDDGKELNSKHEWLSIAGILLSAIAIGVLILAFVFRSYQVDGPSMMNTLQNNDKLIIWKVPRTWARVTNHAYIPERYDIVVFNEKDPNNPGSSNKKQLIKRVIGLPGERVVLNSGKYTVYNNEHPSGFNPDTHPSLKKMIGPTNNTVDVKLAKDQLFVSGDNRPDSLDSRVFGPINADQIVGKLILRVFPLGSSRTF